MEGSTTTRLEEVLGDFAAEVAALDALVAPLPEEAWPTSTPAEGWDVRDSIAHLALGDDIAHDCATTGRSAVMEEGYAALAHGEKGLAEFERRLLDMGRSRTPREVLDWWRSSNERLRRTLATRGPRERVPWGPNRMSTVSFTTARLMETWAHGVDCFDALGAEPPNTDRLRHVAFLGLRALPYAFGRAGLDPPGPVRLELTSPSGGSWSFGPPDAPTVVVGTAADWCRVATHRDRSGEKGALEATGPDAAAVLDHVQAYL